ncbi:MAG: UvrD-helicase domain-containing protein [Bacteroidetes bacterium]|nr:UvrD-helicase domain-containing protein [Bacteroidota bacterium]
MSFNVYKSSAGSGKTFTLVKNYLAICIAKASENPSGFRHILAITFTNKAANEMKDRIISSLKDLSTTQNNKALLEILEKELSPKLNAIEIKERAGIVLSSILHNYSDFSVSTIDSFVNKIIRTFAHDLNIPAAFEIETDTKKLLNQTIDLLVSKIGHDKDLTNALINYSFSKIDQSKSWNIKKDLLLLSEDILKDDTAVYLEKIKNLTLADFKEIKDTIDKEIGILESSVIEICKKALTLIHSKNISPSDLAYGNAGIYSFFKKYTQQGFDEIKGNGNASKTITSNKWASAKASAEKTDCINEIKEQLAKYYSEIENLFSANESNYILYNNLLKNIHVVAVLNEIEKLITQIKEQNQTIHISEFNRIIGNIIKTEPIPFIYERVGEKYNYLLIDEFQDTSELQWSNLFPLVENSLSNGHSSLIVGDAKQSIYRWRSGNVEQFVDIKDFAQNSSIYNHYKENQLNSNFRSLPEIVKFNNSFFSNLNESFSNFQKKIYIAHEQNYNTEKEGGYVQLNFLFDEINTKKENEQLILEKTKEHIDECIAAGFNYKDIAIISRKNTHAQLIAVYLLEKNIPVISNEALFLKKHNDINFIIEFLKIITFDNCQTSLAYVIQYLSTKDHTIKLIDFFSAKERAKDNFFKYLLHTYSINSAELKDLSLLKIIYILRSIFLKDTPNNRFHFAFIDEVYNFSKKNKNNLAEFIAYWELESYKPSVTIDENENAIQLLTIHKSKGLEFPVVIFPFAQWEIKSKTNNKWVFINKPEIPKLSASVLSLNKQLLKTEYESTYKDEEDKLQLDTINLLYVALTRPEQRLYILSSATTQTKEERTHASDYFIIFLKKSGLYSPEQTEYCWGQKNHIQKHNKKAQSAIYQLTPIKKEYYDINQPKLNPEKLLSETDSSIRKGILLHQLLSYLTNENDIAQAIDKLEQQHILNNSEKETLLANINLLLSNTEIKKLFSPTNQLIVSEKDLLVPKDAIYRPDRVIIDKNIVSIVDYKTGSVQKTHELQVKNYETILKKMGYTEIKKYLLYTDKPELISID